MRKGKHLLRRFLTEDPNTVKTETIAAIQQSGGSSDWPTTLARPHVGGVVRSHRATARRAQRERAEET